ncbi:AMP-binding protein [Mammaliicoccus fleurettii]|uniref:AMP-binding protein n=1 Tax=Mammaliicoccus fleurettii TaxID=150056 RepID=UPI002DC04712|nr:AMP-binding protein [Mammaliicoccus fleurettii]MEB6202335.1 AMP-binding protein [Mammaliicoccus fleurettii]
MKILDLIKEQVYLKQEVKAIYIENQSISFRELWNESEILAGKLKQYPENIMVGIAIKHPIQFMKWYIATLMNNQIPCVFDVNLTDEKIKHLIDIYYIDVFIADSNTISYFNHSNHNNISNDTLHIGFTSGTTGTPKAYMRNNDSWVKSFKYNEKLIQDNTQVIVAPGPHAHSLSLYAMVYALCTGRGFIGQCKFNAQSLEKVMNKIKEQKTMFIVPTMLHSLLNYKVNLEKVNSVFSSGAKLSNTIFQTFKKEYPQIDVIEFFGSSEASFISYNINGNASIESVGKLFPSVKVKFTNQDKDKVGILYVKSDMIFSGYLNDEKFEEWIKIGDWASISEQNELFLYGRESDRLIIGGKNIYPESIEQNLLNSKEIDEAIIISEKHNKFGEIAVLIYKGQEKISYLKVKELLLECGLSRYEIPSKLIKVNKMIYTTSGKIARHKMKILYDIGGEEWNQLL